MDHSEPRPLELWQQCIAASAASCVSAFVVQPLDVVKTRMQAQAGLRRPLKPATQLLRYGSVAASGLEGGAGGQVPLLLKRPPYTYSSGIDGFQKIIRHEGLQTLWRGTDLAVAISVPFMALYLPLYDYLHQRGEALGLGIYSPALAGALARTAAVVATSPLELLKVRLQAMVKPGGSPPSKLAAWRQMHLEMQHLGPWQRVRGLWRGVGATLAKDLPFAVVFWSSVEPIRHRMLPAAAQQSLDHVDAPPASRAQILAVNAGAGCVAGGLASALTTPLDVVKTKAQTSAAGAQPPGIARALVGIARKQGVRALFAGVGPRTARTAAAYAILMASYELCKSVVAHIEGEDEGPHTL
ncbi:hypothetical protein WJX72_010630 [[Myrmecia] bisecta]|uniref:Mitochondrial carrier protein n=1 Tax=[Myrmecia] bisecta TaxID=41462 RepID=A0AAW1R8W4_9CHLO